jgi:hypothetical protein
MTSYCRGQIINLRVQIINLYGRSSDATNDIVKQMIEYASSIPREGLRLRKGRSKNKTALTAENPPEITPRQDHGGCRGQTRSNTTAESGGESDV